MAAYTKNAVISLTDGAFVSISDLFAFQFLN